MGVTCPAFLEWTQKTPPSSDGDNLSEWTGGAGCQSDPDV